MCYHPEPNNYLRDKVIVALNFPNYDIKKN